MSETLAEVKLLAHHYVLEERGLPAYQMPRGVVVEAGVGCTVTAASLVKHDDAIYMRIKKAAQTRRCATPRATMNDNYRFARGTATLLVVNCVNVRNFKHACIVCVNIGVELKTIRQMLHFSAVRVSKCT